MSSSFENIFYPQEKVQKGFDFYNKCAATILEKIAEYSVVELKTSGVFVAAGLYGCLEKNGVAELIAQYRFDNKVESDLEEISLPTFLGKKEKSNKVEKEIRVEIPFELPTDENPTIGYLVVLFKSLFTNKADHFTSVDLINESVGSYVEPKETPHLKKYTDYKESMLKKAIENAGIQDLLSLFKYRYEWDRLEQIKRSLVYFKKSDDWYDRQISVKNFMQKVKKAFNNSSPELSIGFGNYNPVHQQHEDFEYLLFESKRTTGIKRPNLIEKDSLENSPVFELVYDKHDTDSNSEFQELFSAFYHELKSEKSGFFKDMTTYMSQMQSTLNGTEKGEQSSSKNAQADSEYPEDGFSIIHPYFYSQDEQNETEEFANKIINSLETLFKRCQNNKVNKYISYIFDKGSFGLYPIYKNKTTSNKPILAHLLIVFSKDPSKIYKNNLSLLNVASRIATNMAVIDEYFIRDQKDLIIYRADNREQRESLGLCLPFGREQNIKTFVFFDINKFKQINDNFGHVEADNILKLIKYRLLKYCFCFSDKELEREARLIDESKDLLSTNAWKTINGVKESETSYTLLPIHFGGDEFGIIAKRNFSPADWIEHHNKSNPQSTTVNLLTISNLAIVKIILEKVLKDVRNQFRDINYHQKINFSTGIVFDPATLTTEKDKILGNFVSDGDENEVDESSWTDYYAIKKRADSYMYEAKVFEGSEEGVIFNRHLTIKRYVFALITDPISKTWIGLPIHCGRASSMTNLGKEVASILKKDLSAISKIQSILGIIFSNAGDDDSNKKSLPIKNWLKHLLFFEDDKLELHDIYPTSRTIIDNQKESADTELAIQSNTVVFSTNREMPMGCKASIFLPYYVNKELLYKTDENRTDTTNVINNFIDAKSYSKLIKSIQNTVYQVKEYVDIRLQSGELRRTELEDCHDLILRLPVFERQSDSDFKWKDGVHYVEYTRALPQGELFSGEY